MNFRSLFQEIETLRARVEQLEVRVQTIEGNPAENYPKTTRNETAAQPLPPPSLESFAVSTIGSVFFHYKKTQSDVVRPVIDELLAYISQRCPRKRRKRLDIYVSFHSGRPDISGFTAKFPEESALIIIAPPKTSFALRDIMNAYGFNYGITLVLKGDFKQLDTTNSQDALNEMCQIMNL